MAKAKNDDILFYKGMLATDQKWIERAIVVLYSRQTVEEKNLEQTKFINKAGFTAFDAGFLSYCAKYLLEDKHLSGKFLDKAKKLMPKYAGQLYNIAMEKKLIKES